MKASHPSPRPLWPYILVAVIALVLFSLPLAARAATCAGTADALAALSDRYGEAVLWQGVAQDGTKMMLTAQPDGSSWTLMARQGDDRVCFLAAGTDWDFGGDAPAPAGKEG